MCSMYFIRSHASSELRQTMETAKRLLRWCSSYKWLLTLLLAVVTLETKAAQTGIYCCKSLHHPVWASPFDATVKLTLLGAFQSSIV